MRRMRPLWRFMAAALLMSLPAPISADIGPPVGVRLVGDLHPAKAGEPYEMLVEITVYEDGVLDGFRVNGKKWAAPALTAPARLTLAKNQSHQIRIAAIPDDPNEPLVFEFEYNGHTTRWNFDVSEEFVELMQGSQATAPATGPLPTPPAGWSLKPPPDDAAIDSDLTPGAGAYTITVHGWFGYYRFDGAAIGAPNIAIGVSDIRRNAQEVQTTIGTGCTDDFGYYSIPCSFTPTAAEPFPDIQLAFNSYSFNGRVDMVKPLLYTRYQWLSDIKPDVTGVDVDFGGLVPLNEDYFAGLQVYTDVYRTWYYCYYHANWDTPPVGVMWPDLANSRYTPWQSLIHIPASASYEEGTHSHEYGHHWMHSNSVSPTPDYCNGMCDSPECTHCGWCWEKAAIALTEGFPDFMGWLIPRSFGVEYGVYAIYGSDFDFLGKCQQDNTYHDPYYTEGFFAAALQDICDPNTYPDSHFVYGPYADALHLDPAMCFWVAGTRYPNGAIDYLMQFLAEYPQVKNGLWETAINCGYQIDLYLPGMVGQLTSPTHELNVESTNPNVVLTWTTPDDDASGVAGYSLRVASDTNPPDYTMDIGPVETTTVGPLSPGTYYFGFRAVDRAGRWSESVVAYGPVIIGQASPADLEFEHRIGWSREVVPRSSTDATILACPDPPTLVGDMTATWWNTSWRNSGPSPTPSAYNVGLILDGRHDLAADHVYELPLDPFTSACVVNEGPIQVRGGRHTLEGDLDWTEVLIEGDENNNRWAHQWVWTPNALTSGEEWLRPRPPLRTGGWSSVVDGSTLWFNCTGHRFRSNYPWTAIAVRAVSSSSDYDCRLHTASTGASNGFAGNIGYSASPAGCLDILVVNQNTTGTANWDVGVLRKNDDDNDDYRIAMITNGYLSIGDSITTHFDVDEQLKLWQFNVPAGGPWPLMITIEGDAEMPVWALYLDETYTTGAPIVDYDAYTSTVKNGYGFMKLVDAQPGNHCLIAYRNPTEPSNPTDVTIEIQTWPPEFQHNIPAGWYRSITPRPAPDGTPFYAPKPDTLLGNVASTYFNISCENDSPTDAPFLKATIDLDGVPSWWFAWGLFPGGGVSIFNWTAPQTIRGGRHMLAFKLDPYEEIEEVREDDNVWGEQYCWSPIEVPVGTVTSRAAPPERMGGWFDNTSGAPLWYNSDGLRLPNTGIGWWKAVAVMPAASSNVDIRLHDPLVGAVDGFGAHLAYSGWSMDNSDYVLVNYNRAPATPYDAGVLRISGSQNYDIHSVGSVFHEWDGDETYGPYTMGAGEIVHLHEFLLNGPVQFSLRNLSGSVDWGITLHTHDEPFLSKSDAPDSCYAWLNGPGMNEYLSAQIAVHTYYCLAVWKRDSASLPLEGTYELQVSGVVTGVESGNDIPPRTALASVYPNPFNPQTKIEYDVASQQRVVLEIFDISGAKVRALVDEVLPAQRHVVVWDGKDDAGNAVASGVYFLRMAAGDIIDVKKVVLLK